MISFLFNLFRLLRAIARGVRQDWEFRALLALLFVLVLGSTAFYVQVEKWSIVDALYFSVMTMATIGYGDLVPSSEWSKVFTIVFSVLSIGVFAAVVSKIVAITLQQRRSSGKQRSRMDRDKRDREK